MNEKINKNEGCCATNSSIKHPKCCSVNAIIPIDGRGQIVIPKDLRDKAGIKAGDKLAVISSESEGKVCCISLVKVEELKEAVKGMLGPMIKEIFE